MGTLVSSRAITSGSSLPSEGKPLISSNPATALADILTIIAIDHARRRAGAVKENWRRTIAGSGSGAALDGRSAAIEVRDAVLITSGPSSTAAAPPKG